MTATSIFSAARAMAFAAVMGLPAAALAQPSIMAQEKPATPAAPAKPQAKPATPAKPAAPAQAAKPAAPAAAKPADAKPAAAKPAAPAAAKPAAAAAAKPAAPPAAKPAATPAVAKPVGSNEPKLLGQYGEWGAYTASPNGKKLCFALAKPGSSQTNPPIARAIRPISLFRGVRTKR